MSETDEQVIALVAAKLGIPSSKLTPTSRLREDLGVDGDEAVEFFQVFEERFSPDLSPLYSHWLRHFDPEGLGWPDTRLNWAAFASLSGLLAALFGILPVWSGALGGAGLLATMLIGWTSEAKRGPHLEIMLQDLVQAAATGRWPLSYGTD